MKKTKTSKRVVDREIKESELMPEMVLRNNIRFFAPFINPKTLSPFSRETMIKFINEWNKELNRRGLSEEKI